MQTNKEVSERSTREMGTRQWSEEERESDLRREEMKTEFKNVCDSS